MSGLDKRGNMIRAELEDARILREEAQRVLADYQKKRQEAEAEAAEIVRTARVEAERLAADAQTKLADFVTRRTRMAEQKIAQAEAQATADVARRRRRRRRQGFRGDPPQGHGRLGGRPLGQGPRRSPRQAQLSLDVESRRNDCLRAAVFVAGGVTSPALPASDPSSAARIILKSRQARRFCSGCLQKAG